MLVLLPKPVHVQPGDTLRVATRVTADSERPSYRFDATLLPRRHGARPVSLGRRCIAMEDLYPDYGDV